MEWMGSVKVFLDSVGNFQVSAAGLLLCQVVNPSVAGCRWSAARHLT